MPRVVALAQQIADFMKEGVQIALVSSGAIAAGKEVLDFPELPKTIPGKQMLAAVGQPRLMNVYEQIFGIYGVRVAQVLLTREDISDRRRYLNARNTLESLLGQGVLPIINENDTVATEEIRIGDNDNLSAMVANLIEADLLVLLTDQDGLFTADPRRADSAELVREIRGEEIPKALWDGAGGSCDGLGTGGMMTKLQAAEEARKTGAEVVITNGGMPDVLRKAVSGEEVGTRILPSANKLESRKRFLLAGAKRGAFIQVDRGAAEALRSGGSLLPVGVTGTGGQFERGDIVRVRRADGKECAVGMTNYSSEEVGQIQGKRSSEIEGMLGYAYGEEVIHHDHMAITGSRTWRM